VANANPLEKLINSFYGVPLPTRLPSAPTKRISNIAWRGDGVDPFSYEGGWSTEAPDQMQSMKTCHRRRVDLKYLRHGQSDYLDLVVVIGPKSNEKEWFDIRGMMRQAHIMHGKSSGKQSFIAITLEADITLCNVRMSAHDLYQKVLELRMSRFS